MGGFHLASQSLAYMNVPDRLDVASSGTDNARARYIKTESYTEVLQAVENSRLPQALVEQPSFLEEIRRVFIIVLLEHISC